MDNVIDGLSGKLEAVRAELADTQVQLENARTELVAPICQRSGTGRKDSKAQRIEYPAEYGSEGQIPDR